jgi:hypothetical protein
MVLVVAVAAAMGVATVAEVRVEVAMAAATEAAATEEAVTAEVAREPCTVPPAWRPLAHSSR